MDHKSGDYNILNNPALKLADDIEKNEEWSNFMHRVGQVSSLVKDLTCKDENRAQAAQRLADKYLDGKVILDEDAKLVVKSNRTVINQKAFKSVENKNGEVDKEAWMTEMSKDAERRTQERKVRRERADTYKTQAVKAFRREEYERALSCYNKAIDQVKDNAMLYCDRALTNIRLKSFDKVFKDCDTALRLNENSFKARLYKARAHLELDELDKFREEKKAIEAKFPQHNDLIEYFLKKTDDDDDDEGEDSDDEKQ